MDNKKKGLILLLSAATLTALYLYYKNKNKKAQEPTKIVQQPRTNIGKPSLVIEDIVQPPQEKEVLPISNPIQSNPSVVENAAYQVPYNNDLDLFINTPSVIIGVGETGGGKSFDYTEQDRGYVGNNANYL